MNNEHDICIWQNLFEPLHDAHIEAPNMGLCVVDAARRPPHCYWGVVNKAAKLYAVPGTSKGREIFEQGSV